jgi:hypothetical protein
VPATHGVQVDEPATEDEPAGQAEQTVSDVAVQAVATDWPAPHCVQGVHAAAIAVEA